jgi:hypothetical protein
VSGVIVIDPVTTGIGGGETTGVSVLVGVGVGVGVGEGGGESVGEGDADGVAAADELAGAGWDECELRAPGITRTGAVLWSGAGAGARSVEVGSGLEINGGGVTGVTTRWRPALLCEVW